MLTADADGLAIEGNSQVIAHSLQLAVLLAFEPGKNGVAREEFNPAFQGFGDFDAELKSTVHNGRAGVGRKDIRPEFSTGEFAADVHNEIYRFTALRFAFARESEDHIERRSYTGLSQLVGRGVDGFELLKVFIHEPH